MEMQTLQSIFGLALFFFTFLFLLSALLIKALSLSRRRYCDCEVCKAYLTGSWMTQFPNLADWYVNLLRNSPTGSIHLHVMNNVVTANPANVEHMLKTNFHNYPKGKRFSAILGDLLGNGIFTADGRAWHNQRKTASLALGGASVRKHAFDVVNEEIRTRLVPLLSSGSVDLQEIFSKFSFSTICKISFGLDPEDLELPLPLSAYVAAFNSASRLCALRATVPIPFVWKLKRFLNIGSEKELKHAIKMVNELATIVISNRRKLDSKDNHDLLSRFMNTANREEIDDLYLRDVVVSFLLAGRDTVAYGLAALFLLLSKNPSVLRAIREEISHVTKGKTNYEISQDDIKSMHYVHAALHESMRLLPPVPFDSKFAAGDDKLPDGTEVKEGTRVTYHSYSMARMKSLWGPDCNEFRPERWLSKDGVFIPESPFKYPVFQAGLRVCLGRELALMEMKTVIISVLREFDVEVVLRDFPRFAPGLTASFQGGVPACIRRR
jgi:12-hydroxyjasmonoyl-L-amino acid 12-hydroxylase / fatty acid hydroxylase